MKEVHCRKSGRDGKATLGHDERSLSIKREKIGSVKDFITEIRGRIQYMGHGLKE